MLAEVEQTGEYDVEASESEVRTGQLPGFQKFDPSRLRLQQVQRIGAW